jgi:hypothetical protein
METGNTKYFFDQSNSQQKNCLEKLTLKNLRTNINLPEICVGFFYP